MALRWKKNPRPTGLARIGAGPQGSSLRDGETQYATTGCHQTRYTGKVGWYWVTGWGSCVPHKNTCGEPVADEAIAKMQALAYVCEHIKKATQEGAQ